MRLKEEMEVCVNDFSFLYYINTQSFKSKKLKKFRMVRCLFVCVSVCLGGGGRGLGVRCVGDC